MCKLQLLLNTYLVALLMYKIMNIWCPTQTGYIKKRGGGCLTECFLIVTVSEKECRSMGLEGIMSERD